MKLHVFFTGLVSVGLLLSTSGCSSLKQGADYHPQTPKLKPVNDTFYAIGSVDVSTMLPQSGFYPLMLAPDSLAARMMLMQNAKKSIDLQYYEILDDDVGRIIFKNALDAADRGVKVRILMDDIGIINQDKQLSTLNLHPNIEIRVFNPTSYRGSWKMVEMGFKPESSGRRMHIKSFNVDNCAIIIGGRNLAVEYFGFDLKKIFLDNDLLIVGPVASQLSYEFDAYWNYEKVFSYDKLSKISKEKLEVIRKGLSTFKIDIEGNPYVSLLEQSQFKKDFDAKGLDFIFADAKILYDKPQKISMDAYDDSTHLVKQLVPYLRAAQKSLYIVNPYFVPNEKMLELFKELRERGVEIHVLTNSLPSADAPYVYAFYKEYHKRLLDMGVDLHEVKTSAFRGDAYSHKIKEETGHFLEIQLHGKTMLIDEETLIIGSMNLDPRSSYQNAEIVAVVKNKALAQQEMKRFFNIAFDIKNSFKLSTEPVPPYKEFATGREIVGETQIVWTSENLDGTTTKFYDDAGASFMKKLESNLIYYFPADEQI